MKTAIIILVCSFLLTGCQTTHYAWYKPGATPEDTQRDLAEARLRAMEFMAATTPPTVVNQSSYPQSQTYQIQQNYPGNYTVTPQGSFDTEAVPNAVADMNAQAANESRRRQYIMNYMESKGYTIITVTNPVAHNP